MQATVETENAIATPKAAETEKHQTTETEVIDNYEDPTYTQRLEKAISEPSLQRLPVHFLRRVAEEGSRLAIAFYNAEEGEFIEPLLNKDFNEEMETQVKLIYDRGLFDDVNGYSCLEELRQNWNESGEVVKKMAQPPEVPGTLPSKGPEGEGIEENKNLKRAGSPSLSAVSQISRKKKTKMHSTAPSTPTVFQLDPNSAPELSSCPNLEELVFQHPVGSFKAVFEPTTDAHRAAFWTDFTQTSKAFKAGIEHEVFNSKFSEEELNAMDRQAAFRIVPTLVNAGGELRERGDRVSRTQKIEEQLKGKAFTFDMISKSAQKQAQLFTKARDDFINNTVGSREWSRISKMNEKTPADLSTIIKGMEEIKHTPTQLATIRKHLAEYVTGLGEVFRIELTGLSGKLQKRADVLADKEHQLMQMLQYAMRAMKAENPQHSFLPGHLEFLTPDIHICQCVKCKPVVAPTETGHDTIEAPKEEGPKEPEPLWFEPNGTRALSEALDTYVQYYDLGYFYRETNGCTHTHGNDEEKWDQEVQRRSEDNNIVWGKLMKEHDELGSTDLSATFPRTFDSIRKAKIPIPDLQQYLPMPPSYEPTAADAMRSQQAEKLIDDDSEHGRGQWLAEYAESPVWKKRLEGNPFTAEELKAMEARAVAPTTFAPGQSAPDDLKYEYHLVGVGGRPHFADPPARYERTLKAPPDQPKQNPIGYLVPAASSADTIMDEPEAQKQESSEEVSFPGDLEPSQPTQLSQLEPMHAPQARQIQFPTAAHHYAQTFPRPPPTQTTVSPLPPAMGSHYGTQPYRYGFEQRQQPPPIYHYGPQSTIPQSGAPASLPEQPHHTQPLPLASFSAMGPPFPQQGSGERFAMGTPPFPGTPSNANANSTVPSTPYTQGYPNYDPQHPAWNQPRY